MQTGGLAVEPLEAGGYAGDALAALGELGDLLEHRADDGFDALNAAALRCTRNFVDGLLGPVDERLDLANIAVPFGSDLLARGDELANAPLLLDHARVGLDMGDRRHRIDQLREVRTAPYLGEALSIA